VAFLPATIVNFAAAMAVPKLTQRFGNGRVLAGGLTVSVIGMAWLSRVSPDASYMAGLAFPMMLIGFGQGCSLGPLTAAGIAGVARDDAGAASGLVNAAHQLGSSLGLGVLVAASVLGTAGLDGRALLAHRVDSALMAGTLMLALALVLVLALIVRPVGSRNAAPAPQARS